MSLDTSHEELVGICLGVLDKVRRSLLSRNSDERNTLVSRLEPDDLGTFNGTPGFITTVALTFTTFSFLLFLGSSRRGTEETQGTGEQLSGHTLDNSNDVASKLRLNLVSDPKRP